jgi:hypothetical protein
MPTPTAAMTDLLNTMGAVLTSPPPQQNGQAFRVKLDADPSLLTFLDSTSIPPNVGRTIAIKIEWHLFDGSTELQQYQDFFALPDISALETSFTVGGPVREMTAALPTYPPAPITVRPTVTLSVPAVPGSPSLPPTDRPAVDVPVPVVALPTVLALFRHPGFNDDPTLEGKAALIVVPRSSHLVTSEAVTDAADEIIQQLSRVDPGLPNAQPLRQLGKFALLVFGLGSLRHALRAPNVAVKLRSADAQGTIQNLHDIVLFRHRRRFRLGYIDYRASNTMSSLIFIGAPDSQAICYNDTGATGTECLELFVERALVVMVSTLVAKPPWSPMGAIVSKPNDSTNFNNDFESVQIGPPPSTPPNWYPVVTARRATVPAGMASANRVTS